MGIDKIAKAISGFASTLAGTVGVALADGVVTGTEWAVAVCAAVVVAAAVWATPNAKAATADPTATGGPVRG